MNVSTKNSNGSNGSSNPLSSSFLPISSGVGNSKNSLSNILKNVRENVVNTANAMVEPIQESIAEAKNNSGAPFASVGIILTLGICIVAFIILVMFSEQIVLALELLWHQLKKALGYSSHDKHSTIHSTKAQDSAEHPDSQGVHGGAPRAPKAVDNAAIHTMMPGKKEVFNVAQNKYKFSDAEPLCKAFGAELATYDQVKESWQKGADWCNYGWVKGQAAVYPTQQATYDKLQAGPEDQRNACGVPGVNGGYFDNPDMRFGVNCYGTKPSENEVDDRAQMSQPNLTPGALEYDRKVADYKVHQTEIPVNPFAKGVWSG